MKNIFKIFSSENLKKNVKEIFNRFPVSIVIIFLTAILFFAELHYHSDISDFYNKRILIAILALIMTFIFSIATYLSSENSEKNKLQRNLFQLIPVGFWVIFYNIFSLDPNDFENFLFFGLSFAGIIAYLFFSPYLKNLILPLQGGDAWKAEGVIKQSVFYTYFYNISGLILISFIFAWVLFGLGAIGIAATDALFDLDIAWEKTYWNWAIFSLSIVAPLFALTQIPNKKSFLENHFNENAFFSFLIKFVAIPFIYLYFFILYAYTIKVLSNFSEWPKWEVSWLVIWFSIFWYLAYSFSYIFEEKNKLIKGFRKIFPFAVIPQIFMFFYAIYLRIKQYDITVNRYFVVVFGLWLLVISLYFIFSKKKNLIAIPAGLALFIIIISVIPKYNVYSLPEARQLVRLETNLQKAWILQDNKITPLKNYSDISEDLSKNIYSWIDYLCDFNSCNNIKELFPKIYIEIEEESKKEWKEKIKRDLEYYEENKDKYDYLDEKHKKRIENRKYEVPRSWTIKTKITDKIKVKNYFYENEDNRKFFEYSKDYNQDFFPIDTKGYSKMYRIINYSKWNKQENYAEFDAEKWEIIIKENNIEIDRFSLKEINEKLIKKFGKNDKRNLKKEDLTFELEWWKYKIFFENVVVKNPDYKEKINSDKNDLNTYMWWFTRWYLLIK